MSNKRRLEHRESLKAKIIDEAVGIISEDGFDRLTMRLLADRIDYSPRTIYLYFSNKSDLLASIIERVFNETVDRMNSAVDAGIPPQQLFRMMVDRHIRNAVAIPGLYKAVIAGLGAPDYNGVPAELKLKALLCGLLKAISSVSENDVDRLTDIFLASVRSTALLLINKIDSLTESELEQYIALFTETFLRGIKN